MAQSRTLSVGDLFRARLILASDEGEQLPAHHDNAGDDGPDHLAMEAAV